uniref:Uncharacterized protein n=1 Tax=viral metagenome TaxID=1070528 RepID=A0A6C0ARB2_9ZZZZ
MNNINRDYIFNLRDSNIIIPKLKPSTSHKDLNQTDLIHIIKSPSPLSQMHIKPDIIVGPTGPQGISGDRYSSKTIGKYIFDMKENSFISFNIEPGLAYINGNSVIVAEVPTKINSEINSFEGIVQYYNSQSGQIIIQDINNIKGTIEKIPSYYYVNLNAIPQSIISSDISSIQLVLNNNTINISEQDNDIQYYILNLKNNDEVKYIYTLLKNNQKASILIKLDIISNETMAIIYPIININTSYNSNIILNTNTPYAILKIHVIENLLFGDCIFYFKNI